MSVKTMYIHADVLFKFLDIDNLFIIMINITKIFLDTSRNKIAI